MSDVVAGPLSQFLADPEVTDVLVNGVQVWIDRGSGLVRAPLTMGSGEDVRRLAQRLAAAGGRRLDDGCPYVDARLADGTRMHAVLPPIATTGPYLSLRTFRLRSRPLSELVPAPLAELLVGLVAARLSLLISGGTGSGKTTLLNALLTLVSVRERIVVVEDAAELAPAHPHVVGLQARGSNVEGVGAVSLTDLVRQALRMRPDRLVVGEVRGVEVADLLNAFNTGHDGGATTLHANAAAEVPVRLEALGLLGGLPIDALRSQIAAAIQVVLHLRRIAGDRELEEICLLRRSGPGGGVTAWPVWTRRGGIGPAAGFLARLLAERGAPVPAWLRH
ncbi:TadA family conjugal transfer-associated ATPase [Allorhizocola rhizosphaerae]|uniref:TadA family conjugal transfer-associated ATPase n=1 Tax=Allorhizocola rhizosphaerae TaxID=1872709 RepID=UPI000E3C5736|nr:TadA family conjugal transfer-associated ATPase [Allorhizocola rhizosphaerae]